MFFRVLRFSLMRAANSYSLRQNIMAVRQMRWRLYNSHASRQALSSVLFLFVRKSGLNFFYSNAPIWLDYVVLHARWFAVSSSSSRYLWQQTLCILIMCSRLNCFFDISAYFTQTRNMNYRICSRNLRTFFSILAAEKSGCVKYADFFCGGLDLGFILV